MARFANADPLIPGRRIGKYEVVRRLASGGMAEIYLARALGIEGFRKHVVLKRMLPQYAQKPEFVKLFLNEARLVAQLDHPNIATIFDIGEVEGIYFLAMEYLHGEDVSVIAWEMDQRKETIPLEHALTICVGAAAGLHHAHEMKGPDGGPLGIVHRDVSPSNVVVTYQGGVKLLDFGIAKVTAQAGNTATNTVKGKLAYMSPEQCEGRPLDRRSDVFALGVVLYEITTQSRLFLRDSDIETVKAVMACEVEPPSARVPGYSRDLEAIVMKALQKRADDRFATARDLQLCLEGFGRDHKLLLSNASLGEWLNEVLGAKDEPWEAVTSGDETAPPQMPSNPQSSTRIMSDGDIERAMAQDADATAAIPNAPRQMAVPVVVPGAPMNPTAVMSHAELRPRRPWGVYAMGAAATLAGLSALGVSLLRPPPAASSNQPLLVMATGQVEPEGPVQQVGGTAGAQPQPPPQPEPADKSPVVAPPKPRKVAARPVAPKEDPYRAAFARRQKQIQTCANAAPDDASSGRDLEIRFSLGTDGRPTAVEVLPADVARTKLGTCVAEVGRGTEFGPQESPVVFRIPVKVQPAN